MSEQAEVWSFWPRLILSWAKHSNKSLSRWVLCNPAFVPSWFAPLAFGQGHSLPLHSGFVPICAAKASMCSSSKLSTHSPDFPWFFEKILEERDLSPRAVLPEDQGDFPTLQCQSMLRLCSPCLSNEGEGNDNYFNYYELFVVFQIFIEVILYTLFRENSFNFQYRTTNLYLLFRGKKS